MPGYYLHWNWLCFGNLNSRLVFWHNRGCWYLVKRIMTPRALRNERYSKVVQREKHRITKNRGVQLDSTKA